MNVLGSRSRGQLYLSVLIRRRARGKRTRNTVLGAIRKTRGKSEFLGFSVLSPGPADNSHENSLLRKNRARATGVYNVSRRVRTDRFIRNAVRAIAGPFLWKNQPGERRSVGRVYEFYDRATSTGGSLKCSDYYIFGIALDPLSQSELARRSGGRLVQNRTEFMREINFSREWASPGEACTLFEFASYRFRRGRAKGIRRPSASFRRSPFNRTAGRIGLTRFGIFISQVFNI